MQKQQLWKRTNRSARKKQLFKFNICAARRNRRSPESNEPLRK
jgi:hypothetical protein